MLTRSLPSCTKLVVVYDVGPWRLVYLRELGEAWWCVPGCRRLGQSAAVGLA